MDSEEKAHCFYHDVVSRKEAKGREKRKWTAHVSSSFFFFFAQQTSKSPSSMPSLFFVAERKNPKHFKKKIFFPLRLKKRDFAGMQIAKEEWNPKETGSFLFFIFSKPDFIFLPLSLLPISCVLARMWNFF